MVFWATFGPEQGVKSLGPIVKVSGETQICRDCWLHWPHPWSPLVLCSLSEQWVEERISEACLPCSSPHALKSRESREAKSSEHHAPSQAGWLRLGIEKLVAEAEEWRAWARKEVDNRGSKGRDMREEKVSPPVKRRFAWLRGQSHKSKGEMWTSLSQ